ncbi:MAG: hypothetical protein DWQ05_11465 [Calditrichaeota bacterium]|nr:MAG: hypothetical protein DWQ05_11465 [Calditrichota bacterium]
MSVFSTRSMALIQLPVVVVFILTLLTASCTKSSDDIYLARFDGGEVSQREYVDHYLASTQYKPEQWPTEENLQEIVKTKALKKMTILEAEELGYRKDSTYIETLAKNESRVLFTRYMRDEIINKVISDSLVNKFHTEFSPQTNMFYIMRPFVVESSAEFISSQKDTIEHAYKLLQKGKPFAEVAARYSQDIASNKKGGDIGYIIPESMGDIILRAAMDTMATNTFSKPIKGIGGYYILFKGKTRKVVIPPLAQVRDRIWKTLFRTRRHLIQAKVDKTISEVGPRYNYRKNDAAVETIKRKLTGKSKYDALDSVKPDHLSEDELKIVLATFDGGEVKVADIFADAKKAPENISGFNKKLMSLIEQHVLALHARELNFQEIPEIKSQLINIREELLRSLLYKNAVKDKIAAQLQLANQNNESGKQKNNFDIERELREKFESMVEKKYNFKFVNGSFGPALTEARRLKEIQVAEKKAADKNKEK